MEARARSYLAANCAHCHRPGGAGQGGADLRWETAADELGICDVDPQEGDLGVAGAKLLVPGAPELSLVSLRMHATEAGRMPPLGTSLVDVEGVDVVDQWIRSLASCP